MTVSVIVGLLAIRSIDCIVQALLPVNHSNACVICLPSSFKIDVSRNGRTKREGLVRVLNLPALELVAAQRGVSGFLGLIARTVAVRIDNRAFTSVVRHPINRINNSGEVDLGCIAENFTGSRVRIASRLIRVTGHCLVGGNFEGHVFKRKRLAQLADLGSFHNAVLVAEVDSRRFAKVGIHLYRCGLGDLALNTKLK